MNIHCTHAFDQIRYLPKGSQYPDPTKPNGRPWLTRTHDEMDCANCKQRLGPVVSAQDFLDLRMQKFEAENGGDPYVARDMFYQPIQVGCTIVYPTGSGSQNSMAVAEVLVINPNYYGYSQSFAEWQAEHRHGEPFNLKLQPLGFTSRGIRTSWGRPAGDIKVVTISSTAGSAVRVNV